MRQAADTRHGRRLNALIVVLWRAGLVPGQPARRGSGCSQVAHKAGVRRRFAPHQLRHAHAVELLHEGIPLLLIQHQLGHSQLSTTGTYLQGIDTEEIISTVHARRALMMHASAGLAP